MEYHSILFNTSENEIPEESCTMPEFFGDLNLDQVIGEILEDKEEYNLNVFFYQGLKDISGINYRLEVMQELEDINTNNIIVTFSNDMKKVREFIGYSQNIHNQYQSKKWLADAAMRYCNAVLHLAKALMAIDIRSSGMRLFSFWLTKYIDSDGFKSLFSDTDDLIKEFNNIQYSVQVQRDKIVVSLDDSEDDYCALINSTFEKLNEVKFDYQINFHTGLQMCNLENKIMEIVKKMNLETFNKLDTYYEKHVGFLDKTIKRFDREVQFYISYINYTNKLKRKGFNFAYPCLSPTKSINIVQGYDLALAYKCLGSGIDIILNDFYLEKDERIFILTGPNQGGKTTFARTLGQILFLTSIGCAVPCQKAELFPFDNIFTHFSLEENLSLNAGRLKEELFRLKQITDQATANSILILNELFASTTTHDAYKMGKSLLDYIIALDCVCLYVTHIYELTQISKKAVSLVAAVNSNREATRSYKIVRKPADGRAYANSIVEKYNLTYSQIKERMSK